MKKLVSLTMAFTFGMAALSIPALALAVPRMVIIENFGLIIGGGEAVALRVMVACTDDTISDREFPTRLTVFGGQPPEEGGAVGRRTQEIENCNRTRQTVKVVVTAGTSLITEGLPDRNQRFRPGSFHAGATLFACKNTGGAYTDCRELTDRETIQIK